MARAAKGKLLLLYLKLLIAQLQQSTKMVLQTEREKLQWDKTISKGAKSLTRNKLALCYSFTQRQCHPGITILVNSSGSIGGTDICHYRTRRWIWRITRCVWPAALGITTTFWITNASPSMTSEPSNKHHSTGHKKFRYSSTTLNQQKNNWLHKQYYTRNCFVACGRKLKRNENPRKMGFERRHKYELPKQSDVDKDILNHSINIYRAVLGWQN